VFTSSASNGQVTTYTSSIVENVPVVQATANNGNSGSSKAIRIVGIVFAFLGFIGIFGCVGNILGAFS
jgi:hypothetical protein